MDRSEVVKLVMLAAANFPQLQEKDMRPTASLWQKMLSDISYEIAELAMIKVLSTAKFFPTVADVRDAATQLMNPKILTAMEAWDEVMKAVRRYGSYQAPKALESLSPDVRNMVNRFGFIDICRSEQPDIIRAHFIKAWDAWAKNEKEMGVLPAPIRQMIAEATTKVKSLKGAVNHEANQSPAPHS